MNAGTEGYRGVCSQELWDMLRFAYVQLSQAVFPLPKAATHKGKICTQPTISVAHLERSCSIFIEYG